MERKILKSKNWAQKADYPLFDPEKKVVYIRRGDFKPIKRKKLNSEEIQEFLEWNSSIILPSRKVVVWRRICSDCLTTDGYISQRLFNGRWCLLLCLDCVDHRRHPNPDYWPRKIRAEEKPQPQ